MEAQTHQTLRTRQTYYQHGMKVPGEIAESAEGAQLHHVMLDGAFVANKRLLGLSDA